MMRQYGRWTKCDLDDLQSLPKALNRLMPMLSKTILHCGKEPENIEWIITTPEGWDYDIFNNDIINTIGWKARFDLPDGFEDGEIEPLGEGEGGRLYEIREGE